MLCNTSPWNIIIGSTSKSIQIGSTLALPGASINFADYRGEGVWRGRGCILIRRRWASLAPFGNLRWTQWGIVGMHMWNITCIERNQYINIYIYYMCNTRPINSIHPEIRILRPSEGAGF